VRSKFEVAPKNRVKANQSFFNHEKVLPWAGVVAKCRLFTAGVAIEGILKDEGQSISD
jgi:hypothetical protein